MADAFRIVVNADAGSLIGDALEEFFVKNLGPRIQANARRTVPVRTGDLKRSIIVQTERTGDDTILQVGVDSDVAGVDYGRFVEQGTSRAPAQPYLRPAVYQARGSA